MEGAVGRDVERVRFAEDAPQVEGVEVDGGRSLDELGAESPAPLRLLEDMEVREALFTEGDLIQGAESHRTMVQFPHEGVVLALFERAGVVTHVKRPPGIRLRQHRSVHTQGQQVVVGCLVEVPDPDPDLGQVHLPDRDVLVC